MLTLKEKIGQGVSYSQILYMTRKGLKPCQCLNTNLLLLLLLICLIINLLYLPLILLQISSGGQYNISGDGRSKREQLHASRLVAMKGQYGLVDRCLINQMQCFAQLISLSLSISVFFFLLDLAIYLANGPICIWLFSTL